MRAVLVAAGACGLLAACGLPERSEGKKLVASQLRDPRSAQFQNVTVAGRIFCGEVNAKNGMGGYAGFRRFIADLDRGEVTFAPDRVADADVTPETAGAAYAGVTFDLRWTIECQQGKRLLPE